MKIKTENGMAATELVLILPLILAFLWGFMKLFKATTQKRFELINAQHAAAQDLNKNELMQPVLERPCLVAPEICAGRKR